MKKITESWQGSSAMLAVVSFASAADPLAINGAGATFPYPLYSKWFYEYSNANPGVKFNYQSIGSGGGIKQITAGTVEFRRLRRSDDGRGDGQASRSHPPHPDGDRRGGRSTTSTAWRPG